MGPCTLRDTRGGNISIMDYHPIPGERGGGGGGGGERRYQY